LQSIEQRCSSVTRSIIPNDPGKCREWRSSQHSP
jgi:hypothetical protein